MINMSHTVMNASFCTEGALRGVIMRGVGNGESG